MKMRIRYNAPVTLTFALIASIVLASDQLLGTGIIPALFTMPSRSQFSFNSIADWIRLFSHIAGHADWSHLLGNFAFILLLGPILEEKYGSLLVLLMLLITALITGLLNGFFSDRALLGASGVVFMMMVYGMFAALFVGLAVRVYELATHSGQGRHARTASLPGDEEWKRAA